MHAGVTEITKKMCFGQSCCAVRPQLTVRMVRDLKTRKQRDTEIKEKGPPPSAIHVSVSCIRFVMKVRLIKLHATVMDGIRRTVMFCP